jgi:hypothetical protein
LDVSRDRSHACLVGRVDQPLRSLGMMTCATTADRDRVHLLDSEMAARLTGAGGADVFEAMLPENVILPAIRATGCTSASGP